jgi:hypothetical protein
MSYAGSGGQGQHTINPTSLSCQHFEILFIVASNLHENFVKILSSIFFLAALQRQPLLEWTSSKDVHTVTQRELEGSAGNVANVLSEYWHLYSLSHINRFTLPPPFQRPSAVHSQSRPSVIILVTFETNSISKYLYLLLCCVHYITEITKKGEGNLRTKKSKKIRM